MDKGGGGYKVGRHIYIVPKLSKISQLTENSGAKNKYRSSRSQMFFKIVVPKNFAVHRKKLVPESLI